MYIILTFDPPSTADRHQRPSHNIRTTTRMIEIVLSMYKIKSYIWALHKRFIIETHTTRPSICICSNFDPIDWLGQFRLPLSFTHLQYILFKWAHFRE